MATHTFLWHDYETFGVQPRSDRPAQFAAIRTDAELNEIGTPLMLYCQPAPDFLPDPQSCLITGITPQRCLEHGVPEHLFAAAIEEAFATPGTIGVGYNTIRFDDEVTRFLFWRNLIDPYAREWQYNCGRWDILDMVRTAYALRPDGIEWPRHAEGRPSFRLEHLTAANGLSHESAHDALSDVRATIALARLIRQQQPRLFDFCVALHKKDRVSAEIGWPLQRPFLHISGMVPPERGCIALVWPLAEHPTNRNELIVWDLAHDPAQLSGMTASDIRLRMFSKAEALPEGVTRLPIKTIHLNKSPIVIQNLQTLPAQRARHWQIDLEAALRHADSAAGVTVPASVWKQVFERAPQPLPDIDEDLYGGFIGKSDRHQLEQLRRQTPQQQAGTTLQFEDKRLEELVFRYRARNFPQTLDSDDVLRWETHRAARLFDGAGNARTLAKLFEEIDALSETVADSPSEQIAARGEEILGALYDYAETIAPARA